jgi:hypothetical protein
MRVIEVLIGVIISFCLLIPFAHAGAKVIGVFPNFVAILEDAPCSNKAILDLIKEEYRKDFKNGVAVSIRDPRQKVGICWTDMENDPNGIFIVDETGNTGGLPKSAFKPYSEKQGYKKDKFRNPPVNDNPRYRNDGRLWAS